MKRKLLVLLLSCSAGASALAQQTTAPTSRTLTPAEQRQKEKVDREVQRERQIRAEWAQKQREYEAKQAEKERQKLAKKAEKEREQQARTQPAAEAPATTPAPVPANQPTVSTPVTEPTRKEKRKKQPEPATATPRTMSATPDPAEAPAATPSPTARPERVRRQKAAPVLPAIDSAATGPTAEASAAPAASRPGREFLPKGHLFEPILLDPLEAQTYGSVLPAYWTEGKKYPGSIVPFAFGFAKPFYRHTSAPGRSEEWVLDLASFTQFEAYYDYKADRARRQIMNTDYKISIIYNIRRGDNNWRFRVYHISSHLGDDYIYRNQLTAPSPNSVNYEQLDVTYSRTVNNWRLYGGTGITLRKTEERKLLAAQLGAFYKKPSTKAARLVGGLDMKFFQQTNFKPGIHGGIGIELGRSQNNLTFMVEGYSGFRPYSQYESQQTSWMGIGLYLNPF